MRLAIYLRSVEPIEPGVALTVAGLLARATGLVVSAPTIVGVVQLPLSAPVTIDALIGPSA